MRNWVDTVQDRDYWSAALNFQIPKAMELLRDN